MLVMFVLSLGQWCVFGFLCVVVSPDVWGLWVFTTGVRVVLLFRVGFLLSYSVAIGGSGRVLFSVFFEVDFC